MSSLLTVEHLTVSLGSQDVLQDISVDVDAGSLLAVLGPNGSGKSTLLRALVGLVAPRSGRILISGSPPKSVRPGRVGYVPQIKSLDRAFPARAIELVVSAERGRWPGRITESERSLALSAMDQVGATHLADRPIGALSGGELQRVYLARAVVRRPELLLLDEPETGVDASGAADLHSLLDRYRIDHGAAVILVTHDWETAIHHATHVLLLRTRQIAFGPPGEAFNDDTVRAAFGHVGHAHGMLSAGRHAHDHGSHA